MLSAAHRPLDDITALLFAESLARTTPDLRTLYSITTLIRTSGFVEAARATDGKGKAYRAVAVAWLNSRRDAREMYYAMTVATTLNLGDEACGLAGRLLTAPGAIASYRGRGATHLAQHGNKSHLPLLEKILTDKFVMYTIRLSTVKNGRSELKTYGVEVRDVALAVSILLTGQKLEDYGFLDRYGREPVVHQLVVLVYAALLPGRTRAPSGVREVGEVAEGEPRQLTFAAPPV